MTPETESSPETPANTQASEGLAPPSCSLFEFNINEYVEVKLTKRGREIHRKNCDGLFASMENPPKYTPPKEDDDGWSKWQMWSLMQDFGASIYMGATEQPFETTIRIHQANR